MISNLETRASGDSFSWAFAMVGLMVWCTRSSRKNGLGEFVECLLEGQNCCVEPYQCLISCFLPEAGTWRVEQHFYSA